MNSAIDLRQFRYFLMLAEELHFGRAAQRLHMSQPPLSRQIRQLEDMLGVSLFERDRTGVRLTVAGQALVPHARRTVAQAETAINAARAAAGVDSGRFVVGYTTVFDRSVIPDVFDRLQERFPHWRLLTQGQHSISLVRSVKNGTMDAAFIGLHTQAAGLTVEKIIEEPLMVALPARHRLAAKRRLDFDELNDEPLFWFERKLNPGFYDHCRDFFARIGFQPPLIAEPSDHHILLGLIAAGQGIALLPASLRKVQRSGVVFRALKLRPENLSMGIGLAYLPSNCSPILRAFLDLVRSQRRSLHPDNSAA